MTNFGFYALLDIVTLLKKETKTLFNLKITRLQNYFTVSINPTSFFYHTPVKPRPVEWFPTPFYEEDVQLKGYFLPSEEEIVFKASESLRCSVSRTRKRIREIAGSMDVSWFATLTISPTSSVDRYSYDSCTKALRDYLSVLRDKCPDLQYVAIPELHKDGAVHFHVLFSHHISEFINFAGSFRLSKKSLIKTEVYHLSSWTYGFTSVIAVKTPARFINYVTKYITKELCAATKHKQRYFYSRANISSPVSQTFIVKRSQIPDIEQFISRITGRDFYVSTYCHHFEYYSFGCKEINQILDFLCCDTVMCIPESFFSLQRE